MGVNVVSPLTITLEKHLTKMAAEKMKIVLLGATGDTGKPLLRQCLDHNHSVTAIVRDPSRVTVTHAKLKVVKGDIFNPGSLGPVFKENDVIISVLGFPKQLEEVMV